MADISHGSNPPSNLILVLILILVADISHGSNPPSKLILNLILILIWKLILNFTLNLILVLILVASLKRHILGFPGLFVSDAIHKAVISVDEKGTEAAAATGMVMMLECAMIRPQLPPVKFHVDQPCSFFIFARGQNPLFAGRLNDVCSCN